MKLRYCWLGLVFLALSMLFASAADAVVVIQPFQPTIAAGKGSLTGHSLAIKKDGSLWAWGYNDYGQLGLGSADKNPHPTAGRVGADTNWVAVAAGDGYSLGIKADGTLWAWGYNEYGQLGLGSVDNDPHPTPAQVGTGYVAVAAASNHSLGLKADGTLWAWGTNHFGELGLGSADVNPHPTPVQVGSGYAAVTAGYEYYGYSLGVKADGTLWAWGRNRYGQLGLESADFNAHPTPVQVGSATNWLAVAGGGGYTLALQADGSLWAWGYNEYGQLGLGSADKDPHPTPAQVGSGYAAVAAGYNHSLGLKADGSLWAWGSNSWGELGLGSSDDNPHPTPVRVGSATGWVAVASGGNHSLGVKAEGSLWAWGDNLHGDLGLGDTTERDSPALVWPRSNPGLNLLLLGD